MSKVGIAGNVAVITSDIMFDSLKEVEKFHPEELTILDDHTKEPIFKIGTGGAEDATIGKYGVVFNGANHDGYATLTVNFDSEGFADPQDAIYEKFGSALMLLNRLEEHLPAVLADMAEEKGDVLASFYYI